MSSTQFAMVEELASLVKDNLPCKHLVLSMEESFVDFLQEDTSSNGVLELEPMNSYSRLLLHRLADIFGFSHHSVGEGEDRHLILERCPETSIPSILVRDLLWQYGEVQSPKKFDILSRKQEVSDGLQVENQEILNLKFSLEEREAAYLAARERIFAIDGNGTEHMSERPRKDLKVARRMIERALGQRIRPSNNEVNCKEERGSNSNPKNVHSKSGGNPGGSKRDTEMKMPINDGIGSLGEEAKNDGKIQKENFREQHVGAAKRMFANALGFSRDGSLSRQSESKHTNRLTSR
ncbi:PREDICTED: cAMP-regulated phosphoprotein 21-like isoform X2 [Ipomoea nil]|uniref:cAMP-regulated phosphoprotein 21-like isoform X2 n=1 Tax=Ipomoea nil TaxID=35883 RepID=UPI0009009423|nr:PREDICTED: cAMP-regulated phosphoprotein 21-like isoform X2 [Ipomoea nil]